MQVSGNMPTFVVMADLIDFLKDNKEHLRLRKIEQDTGVYLGALTKAVNGVEYRHLTDEQEKAVIKYLKKRAGDLQKFLTEYLAESK